MGVPQYTSGTWTGVVTPGLVAVVGPEAAPDVVLSLWEAGADGVVGALGVLVRDGFRGLPPFALVSVAARRVHLAVRGPVEVIVETASGTEVVRSGEVSTWSERVVDDADAFAVRVVGATPGDEATWWPVADGVVPVDVVQMSLLQDDEAGLDSGALPLAAAPGGRTGAGAAPVLALVPAYDAAPEDEVVEPEHEVPDLLDEPVHPDGAPGPPEPAPVPADAPSATDEREAAAEAVPPGHDEAPELVPLVPDDDEVDVPAEPAAPAAVDEEPAPVSPWAVAPEPREEHATPSWAPPAHAVLPEEPASAPRGTPVVTVEGASPDDHDGLTVLSSELAAIREQLPTWTADPVPGPFAMPTQRRRPPQIVLSTGLVVEVDRPVLLGRAPQVERVANRELPRLVTVPSPQQDISRTHAEVRVEGEQVLVTDLDSTNGVFVTRASSGARRLRPGEPSAVDPDEVVDLGDGVTFTVERGS
ncbi:FHA domain-containing protein [Cellulomonas massiliensis]|uniref:FHA domain-containing protein n=1 Tax=Cellulomonas massiliensis TaxID=1465811 RepID=UPI0002F6BF98|nr:FHA domain-containing protein [Cellulomonas massiliensis]